MAIFWDKSLTLFRRTYSLHLLDRRVYTEDGASTFLRNVCNNPPNYSVIPPKTIIFRLNNAKTTSSLAQLILSRVYLLHNYTDSVIKSTESEREANISVLFCWEKFITFSAIMIRNAIHWSQLWFPCCDASEHYGYGTFSVQRSRRAGARGYLEGTTTPAPTLRWARKLAPC
jgi:hypothetical protein